MPNTIAFWASVVVEALAQMYSYSTSAKLEARRRRQEEILFLVLPLLNDALSVRSVPDLHVAAYMIITVISSKSSLEDRVLHTLMEAIVVGWQSTVREGLVCLAFLTHRMLEINLPSRVLQAISARNVLTQWGAILGRPGSAPLAKAVALEGSSEIITELQQQGFSFPEKSHPDPSSQLLVEPATNGTSSDVDVKGIKESPLEASYPFESVIGLIQRDPGVLEDSTTLLAFLARAWTSCRDTETKQWALAEAEKCFKDQLPPEDVQFLLPYLVVGFGDEAIGVRKLSQALFLQLQRAFKRGVDKRSPIYGSRSTVWLSRKDVQIFMDEFLAPHLESFVSDADHVSHQGAALFKSKKLKSSARAAIFEFLCNHIVLTPSLTTKIRLLELINKVKGHHRLTHLRPLFFQDWARDETVAQTLCALEGISTQSLYRSLADCLVLKDADKLIETLFTDAYPPRLLNSCSQVLTKQWPQLSHDRGLPKIWFDAALKGSKASKELLLDLPLSSKSLLQLFPTTSHSAKRQKTEHLDVLDWLKRTTLLLELCESNAGSPEMIPMFFSILSQLQDFHAEVGQSVGFLEVSVMNCISSTLTPDCQNIQTEAVIKCLQATKSVQVRNAALLLLSKIAKITPQQILHDVMPVFTYMGSNMLEDDNSLFVMKQCLDTIVPAFLQTSSTKRIAELLLSFVAAFPHIPTSRRIDLFTTLMNKVGDQHLFILLVLMIDSLPKDETAFLIDLLIRFSPDTIWTALNRYLDLILQSWEPDAVLPRELLRHPLHDAAARLLPPFTTICSSQRLSLSVLQNTTEDTLQKAQELLLKTQDHKRLNKQAALASDALLALLPMPSALQLVHTLLQQHQFAQGLLDTLNRRLEGQNRTQKSSQAALDIVRTSLKLVPSAPPRLQIAAVVAMGRILDGLGKHHPQLCAECTALLLTQNQSPSLDLQIENFLCLATILEELREAFIPYLNASIDYAISSLHVPQLQDAILTFLALVLSYLPSMIAADRLGAIVLAVYAQRTSAGTQEVLNLVARRTEPSICVTMLQQTWSADMDSSAAISHLEMMQKLSKSTIRQHCEGLASLLLQAFDLDVADTAICTAIGLVFNLNDAAFGPIFERFRRWSLDKTTRRRTIWYKFLHQFFSGLKVRPCAPLLCNADDSLL